MSMFGLPVGSAVILAVLFVAWTLAMRVMSGHLERLAYQQGRRDERLAQLQEFAFGTTTDEGGRS